MLAQQCVPDVLGRDDATVGGGEVRGCEGGGLDAAAGQLRGLVPATALQRKLG